MNTDRQSRAEKFAQMEIVSYDDELKQFDQTYDEVEVKRKVLSEKLESIVLNMDLNPAGLKPSEIEGRISILSAYMKTLEDTEKHSAQRVNTKLKRKDSENQMNTAAIVAEYLRKLTTTNTTTPTQNTLRDVDAELEARADEIGPIMDTELRTDPMDLSE